MELLPTIGLEIHAELKTRSKMFCGSPNQPDDSPANACVCAVCLAHPGTLPVINREAVRQVLRVGSAIGGRLAEYTEFDRKNYFYPDLPKGYQISQYAYPLVQGGSLAGIRITRIHLEEDTASSIHDPATEATFIDYNRAGVPLMELVTEPEIHSAEQAGKFGRELQLILRYLGAADAQMEKGQMRVEANISVAPVGELGTKVEVKNLNSFRSMERAVAYEIERQTKLLREGKVVIQETRGWDEARQETFAQRKKEGSADYRYFPDPDLPKLIRSEVPEYADRVLRDSLPELPEARRERYRQAGIKVEDADFLVRERVLGDFFDQVCSAGVSAASFQLLANYIVSDLTSIIRDIDTRDDKITIPETINPLQFAELISMLDAGKLSSRGAKDVLVDLAKGGGMPSVVAAERGLLQNSDPTQLRDLMQGVIDGNPTVAADVRSGNVKALQFFIGQGMKASRGSADPKVLEQVARSLLGLE